MLVQSYKDLKKYGIKVPGEIQNKLLLLHSYITAKRFIKSGDHESASWLLNRVCKNISQFQQHAINILTSLVIESSKANFKDLAYNWACVLVRPEYRQLITEKYKSKIESIARRPIT
jgi:WD repeat-containing protein 19